MAKKILDILFSMKTMAILVLIFAASCGIATFIENDFGTESAWAKVYETKWFEIIQFLLTINLIGNIFRFKLYKKEKLPAFIFHVGFILIFLGSAITRYVGFEGTMHIREGESQNIISSLDPYIQIETKIDQTTYNGEYRKLFSKMGGNDFAFSFNAGGEKASIKFKEFLPNAVVKIKDDPNGSKMALIVAASGGGVENLVVKEGKTSSFGELNIFFANEDTSMQSAQNTTSGVKITLKDGKPFMSSNEGIEWLKMENKQKGSAKEGELIALEDKMLYSSSGITFALKQFSAKGVESLGSEPVVSAMNERPTALLVELSYKGQTKEVPLYGRGRGSKGVPVSVNIANQEFKLQWGSKAISVPFAIKLEDFKLDRYPGSMSPSSYESVVKVEDKNKDFPFRIYMNNVLDYGGYRFFQSSYDQDELGTVLSVNKDPGKLPTYLGYLMLGIGFMLNIFNPNSRFRKLLLSVNQSSQGAKKENNLDGTNIGAKAILGLAFVVGSIFSTPLIAQQTQQQTQQQIQTPQDPQEIIKIISSIDKTHAQNFAKLLVQDQGGRIKPVDTLSREIVGKVSSKESFLGLDANQIFLGMTIKPLLWQKIKIIKVFHPELKKILGLNEADKYAAFADFFSDDGQNRYLISEYVEIANRKKPAERNQFDKDILKVDERLNICYMAYMGDLLKIFPKKDDSNKNWHNPKMAVGTFDEQNSQIVKDILLAYFDGVSKGISGNGYEDADVALQRLKNYQKENSTIEIDYKKQEAEIFFNKIKIFENLTPVYLIAGFILLFIIFGKMFVEKLNVDLIAKIAFWVNVAAFVVHTGGLGLRWYVAEHAPWSDGYESMIYIAWAISLSGIIFARTSAISLSLTSIMAGVTLFVAHLSWMDPQITNLVPVLKSYWLNIHVSVITASYGFLGLCSLLGFFTLILFLLKKPNDQSKRQIEISKNIQEATKINEMAMILGISLLTLGNFLGGVWANESWGRYWGWDPKETWALVSILVYTAVLHIRFIPVLNSQFAFAVFSTIAYASIIMTYFGVNFYLSGMHSYAAGDPVPVPPFVYIITAVVFATIALAYPKKDLGSRL